MATTIDIRELPARLQEALALAAAGGEVILTDGAIPRADRRVRRRKPASGGSARRCDPAGPGLRRAVVPDDFWVGHP
jgi:antitoxin (DNA-binding transcriptional repressor) of toxin-antitoxin stability system